MRSSAVHEDFSREVEVKVSSDRSFGLTITVALGLVAVWPLIHHRPVRLWALAAAAVVLVPTIVRPGLLGPAKRLWLRLGLLLPRVASPVVMAVLFYTTLTPIAIVLRLLGKDLLRRRIDRTATTYWIERRPPGPAPDTMRQQF